MTICEKVHVYKTNVITLLQQFYEHFFHLKTRDAVGWEKDRHKTLRHVLKIFTKFDMPFWACGSLVLDASAAVIDVPLETHKICIQSERLGFSLDVNNITSAMILSFWIQLDS